MQDDERQTDRGTYLKTHTEALVKDLGYRRACALSGRSKATLGRYASTAPEHATRFAPVDVIAKLEAESRFPFVTKALAELSNHSLDQVQARPNASGGLNSDVIRLSQRFATLMAEYNSSITDGVISLNEAKRLLSETTALQQVLMDMKLHLERESRPPSR